MTARSPAAVVATVILAGVLLAAVVQLQAARERSYPLNDQTEESLYLRSGLALRRGRDRMPVPVLAIAGDPSENQGLRSVGAVGSLPFIYLKDTLTRLILELTG